MANIITNLKEYRKVNKISQQALAQLVGVRRDTIVHLENNRYNPSLEMALKIAEIFDCHVEELFQLKKEAEND